MKTTMRLTLSTLVLVLTSPLFLTVQAQNTVFSYDFAQPFHEGYAMVMKDGKCGFIDRTGNLVIPYVYDHASEFRNGYSVVTKDGKKGIIDRQGREIIAPENDGYEINGGFSEGLVFIRKGKQMAFVDTTGKTVIDMSGYSIRANEDSLVFGPADPGYSFHDGLAAVRKDGKCGYIDRNGNTVIPFIFDYAGDFKNGISYVWIGYNKTVFIDKSGTIVYDPVTEVRLIVEPLHQDSIIYVVKTDDTADVIDNTGKTITTLSCRAIWDNLEDTFIVSVSHGKKRQIYRDGIHNKLRIREIDDLGHGMKDKSDRKLTSLRYRIMAGFSEGLAMALKRKKAGFLDSNGKVVIPFKYRMADSFREGLARVVKGKHCDFIDRTGKVVIPFVYDDATSFSEGYAAVKKEGKWGFIDRTGKVAIPFIYDDAISFSEGLAAVKKEGKWGFVDRNGKELDAGTLIRDAGEIIPLEMMKENSVK